MISRILLGAQVCRQTLFRQFRRNLAVTSVLTQKTSANLDPIQQLFLDKVRSYASKSKSGGLVDASPTTMKALQDDLDKITRAYGADGVDFSEFPTFSFADPELAPVGVSFDVREEKAAEVDTDEAKDDSADKPYWQI